ncbi:MAG: hypothetical protein ACM3ZQ_08440 [Bacillota bacterium]
MWMTLTVISGMLLCMAVAMIAVLMHYAHGTPGWRRTARTAAALAGIVLAVGTMMVDPTLYPSDFTGQLFFAFFVAFIVGEGGLRFIVWLTARLLQSNQE